MNPAPEITCSTCRACCCQLEVILMGEDSVPRHLTLEDEWGGRSDAPGSKTAGASRSTATPLLCTIYERRPDVCREYEMGGLACREERAHLDAPPAAIPLVPLAAIRRKPLTHPRSLPT